MKKTNWDDWDVPEEVAKFTCPACNTEIVLPNGKTKSPILLVTDRPTEGEVGSGRAFFNEPSFGMLRTELMVAGIDMWSCRLMNFWLHAPNDNLDCRNASLKRFIDECKDRKAVLMIGSEAIKYITDYSVMDVAGIPIQSQYIKVPLLMAMPHHTSMYSGTVGEVRLSLRKFVKAYKEL